MSNQKSRISNVFIELTLGKMMIIKEIRAIDLTKQGQQSIFNNLGIIASKYLEIEFFKDSVKILMDQKGLAMTLKKSEGEKAIIVC
jgi:hypothetical protein